MLKRLAQYIKNLIANQLIVLKYLKILWIQLIHLLNLSFDV